jgi:hypothetical protein
VAPVSHSRGAPICMNHRYVLCLCTISRILLPQVPAISARLFTCRVNTERARPLHSTYPQTKDKSLAAQTHAESSPSFTFVPYQRQPTSTSSYSASEYVLTAWNGASSNGEIFNSLLLAPCAARVVISRSRGCLGSIGS